MADADNRTRRGRPTVTVVPLKPARNVLCEETIAELEYLLHEARKGAVTGLVYAALSPSRAFSASVTGEAYRNPVFARGMVACLDDCMRDIIRSN